MSIVFKSLLLFLGVVLIIIASIKYFVFTALLAWLAPVQEAIIVLGQSWMYRQLIRPFSKRFSEIVIVWIFGRAWVGKIKARYIFGTLRSIDNVWNRIPLSLRLVSAGGIFILLATSEYAFYLLFVMIPLSSPIIRALHFWGIDLPFDEIVRPIRHKFRRIMRTNAFWKKVRIPYRRLRRLVLKRVETARERRMSKAKAKTPPIE